MKFELTGSEKSHPFHQHWKFCVGSGHAPLAVRSDYKEMLSFIHRELGIKYVRFHGILSDDMGVVNDFADLFPLKGGERFREYNFRHIAAAYDNVLAAGMKPFVEISFMPELLARDDSRCFFYYKDKNVIAPPKDYAEWEDLIRHFIAFLEERYGQEEVRSWYFEVWNEPDLGGFFAGTKEEYFELYRHTATAVKAVDPSLRVGGPATSGSKWVHGFLEFCRENDLPVDFVSTHQYAGDPVGMIDVDGLKEKEEKPMEFGDISMLDIFAGLKEGNVLDALQYMMPDKSETEDLPNDTFRTNAAIVAQQVEQGSPEGKKIPLFYTEWSENSIFSAWTNDTRKEAAYDVKAALDTENLMDGSSVWCFSDLFEEFHIFPEEFHGGFGLVTESGIEKPAFWGLKLLSMIEGSRLELPEGSTDGEIGIGAFASENKTQILLFRQKMKNDEKAAAEPAEVRIPLGHAPQKVTMYRIDAEHGNPLDVWKKMGSPDIPTKEQVKEIREVSAVKEETPEHQYEDGILTIKAALGVNDVYLFNIYR